MAMWCVPTLGTLDGLLWLKIEFVIDLRLMELFELRRADHKMSLSQSRIIVGGRRDRISLSQAGKGFISVRISLFTQSHITPHIVYIYPSQSSCCTASPPKSTHHP